jgi:hypothetical protein
MSTSQPQAQESTNFTALLPNTYKRFVSEWLEEDTPSFDYGGFVVGDKEGVAHLLGKSAVSGICLYYWSHFTRWVAHNQNNGVAYASGILIDRRHTLP